MHLIAGGGGVFIKFNFLIKSNFLFTSQPHYDKGIAAGAFNGENVAVKLAGLLLAHTPCADGRPGVALPQRKGCSPEGSTAKAAATNCAGLGPGGLCPLLLAFHHAVSLTVLSWVLLKQQCKLFIPQLLSQPSPDGRSLLISYLCSSHHKHWALQSDGITPAIPVVVFYRTALPGTETCVCPCATAGEGGQGTVARQG